MSLRKSATCTTHAFWQNRILFSEPERAALQQIKDWGFTDTFRLHTEEGGPLFMVGLSRWWISPQPRPAHRSHLGFGVAGRAQ